MLRLTIDRDSLLKELNNDKDKALARAKECKLAGLQTGQAVVNHFNVRREFRPGSPGHAFLKTYEKRITGKDVVVIRRVTD